MSGGFTGFKGPFKACEMMRNIAKEEVRLTAISGLRPSNLTAPLLRLVICSMLSTYSATALPLLLAALPDLQELVTERAEYFVLQTVSPTGWEFGVYSDDEQLTVEFAEYHCHFGGFEESSVEADVAETVAFIQALRTGELVLAVWYQAEQYMGSYPLSPTEKPEPVVSGPNQVVTIRKWSE
jgi:hypothetical protein